MIKIFFTCLLFIFFTAINNAQVKPLAGVTINKKDIPVVNDKAIINRETQEALNTWIDIYELPNYQGKVVRFTTNGSNDISKLTFTPDRISIKRGSAYFTANLKSGTTTIAITADIPNLRIDNAGISSLNIYPTPLAIVYENQNYSGQNKVFLFDESGFKNGDDITNLNLPFNSSNISVKLLNTDMSLYVFDNGDIPKKIGKLTPGLTLEGNLRKIRFVKFVKIRVWFNGFLTTIHTNDCRRMRGYVNFSITEFEPVRGINMLHSYPELGFVKAFKENSTTSIPNNIFDVNNYWLAERDGVTERYNERTNSGYASNKYSIESTKYTSTPDPGFTFEVEEGALKNNRVMLTVFANLTGNHKGCDLCTDFTDNAGMIREAKINVPINYSHPLTRASKDGESYHNLIQVGKLRTNQSVEINGGLYGPEHPTYLQFSWAQVR